MSPEAYKLFQIRAEVILRLLSDSTVVPSRKNAGYSKTESDYHSRHFKLRGTYNDGVFAVFGKNGAKFDLPPSIILKMLLEHTTRGTDEL